MNLPGAPSLLFLGYLLVGLPLAARQTARRLRNTDRLRAISRERYWRSAVIAQVLLLTLALIAGSTFDYAIFGGEITASDILAGFGGLALCLGVRLLSLRARTKSELRSLSVYRLSPRTPTELAWFLGAVTAASIAEEAAYRGVGWAILAEASGSGWFATVVLSMAFVLAHWHQGRKSGLAILGLALIMHVLVAITQTLLVAMAVHAAYDLIVAYRIAKQARLFDEEVCGQVPA